MREIEKLYKMFIKIEKMTQETADFCYKFTKCFQM